MAETADDLRNLLEKIRDDAQRALALIPKGTESRSLSWKCIGCGHVKHFTRPVPIEVAAPCPKCKGRFFRVR
jgi:hypothetical protein